MDARRLSRSLAGYLCGTHSGALVRRRGDLLGPSELSKAHAVLRAEPSGERTIVEPPDWEPGPGEHELRERLLAALDHPAVVDLVLFGSQARGTTTGFSDVDAVLVVADAAAEQPAALRALRRRVLGAQRAVLAYHPLQHHGFEVATPKLLGAGGALDLPFTALAPAHSLRGARLEAAFDAGRERAAARTGLASIAQTLVAVRSWPGHPWRLQRVVSMFELVPTLYLQARGVETPKWRSFALAAPDFGADWWPYDVLGEARDLWPRRRRRSLEAGALVVRNPWLGVAVWTRLPARPPGELRGLLTPACLEALRDLVRRMEQASR